VRGAAAAARAATHLYKALLLVEALLRLRVRAQQVDDRLRRGAREEETAGGG
jgi:hypothetical protein